MFSGFAGPPAVPGSQPHFILTSALSRFSHTLPPQTLAILPLSYENPYGSYSKIPPIFKLTTSTRPFSSYDNLCSGPRASVCSSLKSIGGVTAYAMEIGFLFFSVVSPLDDSDFYMVCVDWFFNIKSNMVCFSSLWGNSVVLHC